MIILVIWALLTLALYKALQGHKAHKALRGHKELLAHKDHKVLKALRVRKESPGQQVLKALKVLPELVSLLELIFNWLAAHQRLTDLP